MSIDILSFIKGSELIFDNGFNQSLDNVIFPQSLTSITFGYGFNQSIKNVTWSNILTLTFSINYIHYDDLQNDSYTLEFQSDEVKTYLYRKYKVGAFTKRALMTI